MQLGIDAQIPEGLLAENALLAENSRQGLETSSHTFYQGFTVAISNTPLGLFPRLYGDAVGPRCTGFRWSFGNRTDQANSRAPFTNTAGSPCQTSTRSPTQTLASYGSNNQLTSLTPANSTTAITPTYDGAGNMTFDGTNTYLYDAESRVCAVHGPYGMTGYQYDADGNRIGKGSITSMSCDLTVNGYQAQSDYVLDAGGGQMSEMAVDANGTEVWQHTNVTAGGSLIATYDSAGLHFYLNDALGTRRAQTDGYGVLEQTCQSLPFGDGLNCSLSNVAPTEHHFTGKERDTESGLDYFGARYYASNMGRWMSPDWAAKPEAVPYSSLDDPQSLNLYGYVGNNPLTRADKDGHCFWDACVLEGYAAYAVVAAGVAAVVGAEVWIHSPQGQAAIGSLEDTLFRKQAAPGSRPGKDFTKAGKKTIDQTNMDMNNGDNKCTYCKKKVRKVPNTKGEPTPDVQLQRHHIDPKSNGGSGTPENGEVVCPGCHADLPPNGPPVPAPTPAPAPTPTPPPPPEPIPHQ